MTDQLATDETSPDQTSPDRTGTAEDLLRHETVRLWIESVQKTSLRPAADRARRLELLKAFTDHIGVDPDTIVETSRGDAKAKNGYLKQLVAWARALPGTDRARHDAENTIRGFFMRNGFRVVARPYRDVYQRPGGGAA
jgi:hypothetical protein